MARANPTQSSLKSVAKAADEIDPGFRTTARIPRDSPTFCGLSPSISAHAFLKYNSRVFPHRVPNVRPSGLWFVSESYSGWYQYVGDIPLSAFNTWSMKHDLSLLNWSIVPRRSLRGSSIDLRFSHTRRIHGWSFLNSWITLSFQLEMLRRWWIQLCHAYSAAGSVV